MCSETFPLRSPGHAFGRVAVVAVRAIEAGIQERKCAGVDSLSLCRPYHKQDAKNPHVCLHMASACCGTRGSFDRLRGHAQCRRKMWHRWVV